MFLEDGQSHLKLLAHSILVSLLANLSSFQKDDVFYAAWRHLCSNKKKDILKSITAQTIVSDSRRLQKLTQRGNKMFMGTQGFHATLVFVVPDPQSLVISTAYNELSTRVEKHPTHPVIMANLCKTSEYHTQY